MAVIDKLMDMHERWEKNQARKAFDAAMAAAKAEIPVIFKNKVVDFTSQRGRTHYRHEDMAEIARTVDPILARHGLSYRYRTETTQAHVKVTCVLSHRDGHSEETDLIAGHDNSGNKNSIQAIGSTITFLQRYTLKAALGLAASADDDGKAAAEPPKVYDHVRWLETSQVQPFEIVRVSSGDIAEDIREQVAGRPVKAGGRTPSAPFFAIGRGGSAAPIRRQCTGHYKIEPINAECRRRLGYRPRQRIPAMAVEMMIGISTDEVVRAGPAHEPWIVNRYPLLEKRMSRGDCEEWLRRHEYPIPPKSACTFCPYRTDAEWRRLRSEDPDAWAIACEIDALIRGGIRRNDKGTSTGSLFVHRSLKPLAEVDLSTAEERGQGMLMVCEAGCGL